MVRSNGAVSPEILAIDRRTPVITPLRAVLSTTLIVVFQRLIPRAMAASRIEFGTVLMDTWVARASRGRVITQRAMEAARGEACCGPPPISRATRVRTTNEATRARTAAGRRRRQP